MIILRESEKSTPDLDFSFRRRGPSDKFLSSENSLSSPKPESVLSVEVELIPRATLPIIAVHSFKCRPQSSGEGQATDRVPITWLKSVFILCGKLEMLRVL